MPEAAPGVSVVVPTFKEGANVRPVTERVFAALRPTGRSAELVFVDDDSRDGTQETVESLACEYPVRVLVRRQERGLATAVLAGFREARFDRLVVMDADLQHPPEVIPAMLDRLDAGDCDFVLGSRYVGGGGLAEEWAWRRRLASRLATLLSRPLVPLSDPMSGFFALHRTTWERAAPLSPLGYKIGLELYVKAGCRQPAEIPIHFATRVAGESKFGLGEQLRFARHLFRLYRFRFPRTTRLAGAVILLGVLLAATWIAAGIAT